MRLADDITGQKFGKLTAIKPIRSSKLGKSIWLFDCDCGNQKEVFAVNVRNGHTKSCGCIRKIHPNGTIHGGVNTRIYNLFATMKARCNNVNSQAYKDYGGRGIKICDEWNTFVSFRRWALENGYADDLSIDRINNDGDYEPSNCRWATRKEQSRNTRRNIFVEIEGNIKSLSEWCEILKVNYLRAWKRKNKGKHPFTQEEILKAKEQIGCDLL